MHLREDEREETSTEHWFLRLEDEGEPTKMTITQLLSFKVILNLLFPERSRQGKERIFLFFFSFLNTGGWHRDEKWCLRREMEGHCAYPAQSPKLGKQADTRRTFFSPPMLIECADRGTKATTLKWNMSPEYQLPSTCSPAALRPGRMATFSANKDHLRLLFLFVSFLYHLPEHIPGASGLANQPSELWLSLSLAFFPSTSQSSHQIGEKIQHWISIRLLAPHSLVNTWKGLRLDLNLTLSLTQASPDSWPSLLSIIFWRVWRSVLHSAHASNATFFAWSNALWWNPRWH